MRVPVAPDRIILGFVCVWDVGHSSRFIVVSHGFYLFIYFFIERERAHTLTSLSRGGAGAEGEEERESEAASILVQSPMWGSISQS